MITLYQFEASPYCDKVRRILNVKRQPYEVVEVSLLGAGKSSPTRKLPCLDDDGRRVHDSTQIAIYLEERFPDPPLLPTSPLRRRLFTRFGPALLRYQVSMQGAGRRSREVLLEDLERHIGSLADWLDGGSLWLVGDRMSLSDIAVYSQVAAIDVAEVGTECIARHPQVRDWMGRVAQATAPVD